MLLFTMLRKLIAQDMEEFIPLKQPTYKSSEVVVYSADYC